MDTAIRVCVFILSVLVSELCRCCDVGGVLIGFYSLLLSLVNFSRFIKIKSNKFVFKLSRFVCITACMLIGREYICKHIL